MGRRPKARQDARMGGQRDRGRSGTFGEERAGGGQGVDMRSLGQRISIAAEMIRPQGIDGDQQDIGPMRPDQEQRGRSQHGQDREKKHDLGKFTGHGLSL